MKKLSPELFKELANDIMIEISDEEASFIYKTELKIINDFEKVKLINTENIEPMEYPYDIVNTYMREDDDIFEIEKEQAIKNFPETDGTYLIVNKVVK